MYLLPVILALASGAAAQQADAAGPAAPPESSMTSPQVDYQVGAGDVLQVQVYGEAGLSGTMPVNERGEIDFPLLGSLLVRGLSPPDIASMIRDRLADGFLVEPQVMVRVDAFGSQPIQVLGAVEKPGTYYVNGSATVLDLLSQAGGVRGGGVNEVRITRSKDGGKVTLLPYGPLVSQGTGNIGVWGGDIIFVPESLVYVMGEVQKPGSIAYSDGLTVSRCLAATGGAATGANLGRVYILRGDERIRVNVRRILRGKEEDVPVLSGDQIFVQASVL